VFQGLNQFEKQLIKNQSQFPDDRAALPRGHNVRRRSRTILPIGTDCPRPSVLFWDYADDGILAW